LGQYHLFGTVKSSKFTFAGITPERPELSVIFQAATGWILQNGSMATRCRNQPILGP